MFGYDSGVAWFNVVADASAIVCAAAVVGLFVVWPLVDKVRARRNAAADVARMTAGAE